MDRRRRESKLVGSAVSDALKQDLDRAAQFSISEYVRAERCRICCVEGRDLPNAIHVRRAIDRELMNNNGTYRAAVEAAEPFVAEWPLDQRPTYSAVRNHAKKHLNRDLLLVRTLMETYALKDGIDIEQGDSPIITSRGVLALIAQKGYEEVAGGHVTPTIAETIAASRAMAAIEGEVLLAELEEERKRGRLLVAVLQQVAPDALESLSGSPLELSTPADGDLVILPEAEASESSGSEEQDSGVLCDECEAITKTRGGLLRHKRSKHGGTSRVSTG